MESVLELGGDLATQLPDGEACDMPLVTGDQIRAARALIRMEAQELARRAEVSTATIRRVETGANIHPKLRRDLVAVLEAEGVEFIEGGVRWRRDA